MTPYIRARRPRWNRLPRCPGFTLIELMITVAIATILFSIAIPMYLHQIRESRRTDARSALLDLASREERYFATNSSYTSVAANLGYSGFGSGSPVGNGKYYYIDAPTVNNAVNPPSFKLVAHPEAGKGQDQDSTCSQFSVDSTGKQAAQDSSSADQSSTCWGQ